MKSQGFLTRRLLLLLGGGSLLSAAVPGAETHVNSSNPKRVHAVTGLKKDKADYYIKLHAATWPGVLKRIKESNIRNYSIALKEIEGKLYLFSYFEYVGSNYEADMAKIAADPETQRWWKETDPCQSPLPDAKAQGKIWSDAEEVFHTD